MRVALYASLSVPCASGCLVPHTASRCLSLSEVCVSVMRSDLRSARPSARACHVVARVCAAACLTVLSCAVCLSCLVWLSGCSAASCVPLLPHVCLCCLTHASTADLPAPLRPMAQLPPAARPRWRGLVPPGLESVHPLPLRPTGSTPGGPPPAFPRRLRSRRPCRRRERGVRGGAARWRRGCLGCLRELRGRAVRR